MPAGEGGSSQLIVGESGEEAGSDLIVSVTPIFGLAVCDVNRTYLRSRYANIGLAHSDHFLHGFYIPPFLLHGWVAVQEIVDDIA